MNQLYTIFVQYTTEQTESALIHLNKLERILNPIGASERIITDNFYQMEPLSFSTHRLFMGAIIHIWNSQAGKLD